MSQLSAYSPPKRSWSRPRQIAAAFVVSAGLSVASLALAQGGPPITDLQIKYRQGVYNVLGGNFAPLGAMVAGRRPWDAKNVVVRAERVAYMAQLATEVFPEGSGKGSKDAPTKAKPEIWTNKAELDKLMKDLGDKTQALATVAKTGDQGKIKEAFNAAGQACKACHDKFKLE
jgi:cytochrome c556